MLRNKSRYRHPVPALPEVDAVFTRAFEVWQKFDVAERVTSSIVVASQAALEADAAFTAAERPAERRQSEGQDLGRWLTRRLRVTAAATERAHSIAKNKLADLLAIEPDEAVEFVQQLQKALAAEGRGLPETSIAIA